MAMLLACSMVFGTASMTACNIIGSNGEGDGQEQEQPQTVAVTGVSLGETSIELKKGNQKRLAATVAPSNATNKSVTWSSDNPDVADVDQSGNLTAKAKGTAIITVTTVSGGKTDSCTVTVTETEPEVVKVQSVSLNKSSATLKVSETVKLTVTFTPANPDNKNVSWKSSNESIATVSNDGLVSAKAVGKTTVTVISEDGSHSDKCEITVEAASIPTPPTVNVTGVSLDVTSATLKTGQTITLKETVLPINATNKAVTWDSGNKAVATVDNGVVTAVAAGQATITVKTADGNFTETCKITVQQPATDPVVDAKISYAYAGNECAAFEWGDSDAAAAEVEYKLSTASSYT
ncbi:MAG: Ig-like domain-containing protein, partial [Clostridia bacterium]|nr:Ig-like domain-containing protein [Clostridia bacterium]